MLPRPDKNTFLVLEYAIGEFLMNLSEISVILIFMFINLLRSLRNTSEYLFKIYYFSKYFFYCATLSKKKKITVLQARNIQIHHPLALHVRLIINIRCLRDFRTVNRPT